VPQPFPQSWLEGFFSGLLQLAKDVGIELAGGDTAASSDRVLADIVVVGTVPRGRALLRSGARPGDRLYVTDDLGAPAAIIERLRAGSKIRPSLPHSYLFPQPRIVVGRALRQKGIATAMIDISDGLSTDLSHVCEESGVGADVWETALPLGAIGKPARKVALACGLHGGDDYELLFTADPGTHVPRRIAGISITHIGEITRASRMQLIHRDGSRTKLLASGWEHFRKPAQR
jgi:thiamine-monophosphate kinase